MEFLGTHYEQMTLEQCVDRILNDSPDSFQYLVTPNVSHVLLAERNTDFSNAVADAHWRLCDSKVLYLLHRISSTGSGLSVVRGSDLVEAALARIDEGSKKLTIGVVGSSESQISSLRTRYNLVNVHHYNPPMGFLNMPGEMTRAVEFVEQHQADIWFLAVGAPQQELLAQQLAVRNRTHAWALCIGASIDFLTGKEKRAPSAFSRLGLEWLWRLMQDPRGKWRRYLLEGPRIFLLFVRAQFKRKGGSGRG